jgi:8-oxo-dGTP pyrophosphatase MutT (NUDIX family)
MTRLYRQAAVIPYRTIEERVEIALVTSTSGKRWVVPKGSIDEGEQPWEAAVREAEEEGGLIGVLEPKALGHYHYTKENGLYRVDVYLMRVTVVLDRWIEERQRRRRWVAVEEAATCLNEDLRQFLQALEGLVQTGP